MTRRGLRQLLPAFAHYFGIMPWKVEEMPFAEIEAFIDWLPKEDDLED